MRGSIGERRERKEKKGERERRGTKERKMGGKRKPCYDTNTDQNQQVHLHRSTDPIMVP